MKAEFYIPPSCRTAEKHLSFALRRNLASLTHREFVRAWGSLIFLFPGLHPDDFNAAGTGWPRHFQPLATEAWRRFERGEISESTLYCYRSSKAGIAAAANSPWLTSDHFAA